MVILQDQVVIVTGAGRGIGRAIALGCAAEGAKGALTARSTDQLQAVAEEITAARGTALVIPRDVTDRAAVTQMVETVEAQLGPVDVLVNNAGRYQAMGPVWETDPEDWWQDVTVNILGVYLGCYAVLPGMLERNAGYIINLIGGGMTTPFPYASGYGTSKAAVMRFTETLAREAADTGIKVFALDPGLVHTAMTENIKSSAVGQRWMAHIGQRLDEGRSGSPTLAAELTIEIVQGHFDALVGRALFAQSDYQAVKKHTNDIIDNDLYTLRMKRLRD